MVCPLNSIGINYETPAVKAGEEYFKLFLQLIDAFAAIFGSAILQFPIYQNGSGCRSVHAQACRTNTEPFLNFEAEPISDGSTE